jgi:hypothetical protein
MSRFRRRCECYAQIAEETEAGADEMRHCENGFLPYKPTESDPDPLVRPPRPKPAVRLWFAGPVGNSHYDSRQVQPDSAQPERPIKSALSEAGQTTVTLSVTRARARIGWIKSTMTVNWGTRPERNRLAGERLGCVSVGQTQQAPDQESGSGTE